MRWVAKPKLRARDVPAAADRASTGDVGFSHDAALGTCSGPNIPRSAKLPLLFPLPILSCNRSRNRIRAGKCPSSFSSRGQKRHRGWRKVVRLACSFRSLWQGMLVRVEIGREALAGLRNWDWVRDGLEITRGVGKRTNEGRKR